MDIPELAKKTEGEAKADIAHLESEALMTTHDVKSWFQENKEPVIFIAAACLIFGCLIGYWVMKFLEHR